MRWKQSRLRPSEGGKLAGPVGPAGWGKDKAEDDDGCAPATGFVPERPSGIIALCESPADFIEGRGMRYVPVDYLAACAHMAGYRLAGAVTAPTWNVERDSPVSRIPIICGVVTADNVIRAGLTRNLKHEAKVKAARSMWDRIEPAFRERFDEIVARQRRMHDHMPRIIWDIPPGPMTHEDATLRAIEGRRFEMKPMQMIGNMNTKEPWCADKIPTVPEVEALRGWEAAKAAVFGIPADAPKSDARRLDDARAKYMHRRLRYTEGILRENPDMKRMVGVEVVALGRVSSIELVFGRVNLSGSHGHGAWADEVEVIDETCPECKKNKAVLFYPGGPQSCDDCLPF